MSALAGWQVAGSMTALAVGAYTMLPGALPQYTKRFYQQYKPDQDEPVKVNDHSINLLSQVLLELNMPAEKAEKVEMFITCDNHPQYHGTFALKFPCLLGVPANFQWRSVDDFNEHKLEMLKKSFPWTHPASNVVRDSLLLTDAEKQFLLARQLGYIDSRSVLSKLYQQMACLALAYISAHIIVVKSDVQMMKRRGTMAATRTTHFGVFGICSLIGYGIYTLISDAYNCSLERYADKYAATISPEFSRAGYTYYDKIINSNKAMRDIVPGAEKLFTLYGNETAGVVRVPAMSLISRRNYMKTLHSQQLAALNSPTPIEKADVESGKE